jgi:hypothetical protein
MTQAIGGTWAVHVALSQRWTDAGLDAKFRAEWPDPADETRQPLGESEALGDTPVAYCIFEVEQPPVPLGHSAAGDGATEYKRQRVGVVFRVIAKRKDSGESGKSVAHRMQLLVAEAFDPSAGLWPMPEGPDRLMRLDRASEWLVPKDQNTYEGGLRYELFVESRRGRRPD